MNIGFYIADLLRNQDEVSLPGIGTFIKERVAGSYDATTDVFIPPSYRISFSDKLTEVGSLSDYVSTKKNLSQSSAEYFIRKFTTALLDLLKTSGVAEVKPLGVIRQQKESISFETAADFEIPGKFFGLKPIAELQSRNTMSTEGAVIDAAEDHYSIDGLITTSDQDEIDDDMETVEKAGTSRLSIILGAVLFAIATGALLYFFNPVTRNFVDSLFVQPKPGIKNGPAPLVKDSLKAKDSLKTSTPAIAKDSIIVDSSEHVVPETAPEIVETTYEIIGAAFGKRSEANTYIKVMKSKGIQARILENMPGVLFKVSLASFPDYQSAQKELNRIQKEVEKDAWTTPYKPRKLNK